jgi:hypothetical protein
MKIAFPLLMLKKKDLLGGPIPQHLECKNLQTPFFIVCQFSSNGSIKLLPERVDRIRLKSTKKGEDDYLTLLWVNFECKSSRSFLPMYWGFCGLNFLEIIF